MHSDVDNNILDNLDHFKECDFREIMMQLDLSSYLLDDILVKVDRASMSTGLELRLPFLDHKLIEWSWSLPFEYKVRDDKSKWILRQILYKYIPKDLIERPKKGFGIPIGTWLRGDLKPWALDMLNEESIRKVGIFNHKEVKILLEDHLSNKKNNHYKLWNIINFQDWYYKWHL